MTESTLFVFFPRRTKLGSRLLPDAHSFWGLMRTLCHFISGVVISLALCHPSLYAQLAISGGGTGATTAPGALSNFGFDNWVNASNYSGASLGAQIGSADSGLSPSISSFTGTTGTLTFTTSTQSPPFVAGEQVVLVSFTGGNTGLNGQTVTVLSSGLTTTAFEAAVTGSGYSSGSGVANTPGAIFVGASGTINSAITLSTGHWLACASNSVVLTLNSSTATINLPSNGGIVNCQVVSTQGASTVGLIQATSQSNVQAKNLVLSGGYQGVVFSGVSDFVIDGVNFTGPPTTSWAAGNLGFVNVTSSSKGTIRDVYIGPNLGASGWSSCSTGNIWVVHGNTSATGAGVEVFESDSIDVENPNIQCIDFSEIEDAGGVGFGQTNRSNLVGGIVSTILNGDGVGTYGYSSDINITGTQSTHNDPSGITPAGSIDNNGDCFDIFQSRNVRLVNVNGTYCGLRTAGGSEPGLELYWDSNISIANSNFSGSGLWGIIQAGSTGVGLINVTSDLNGDSGLYVENATFSVNTAGSTVTFTSGPPYLGPGSVLNIAGTNYTVASATFSSGVPSVYTLQTSAGTQTNVTATVESVIAVDRGEFNNNGVNAGTAANNFGMYVADATAGTITGVSASDTNASTSVAVTGFTGSSGTLTFATATQTPPLVAGQTVVFGQFSSGPSWQQVKVLSAGLSTTSFEAAVGGSGYSSSSSTAYYSKTQTIGINLENTATMQIVGGSSAGNITAPYLFLGLNNAPYITPDATAANGWDVPALRIGSSGSAPAVGTPTVGQAACIKAAGPPVVIGYCSTVVGSGGACTCN
jgi:hypothetical protein